MWGRTSTGRENEVRFTALHPYEVSGAAGPVSGPYGGRARTAPDPIPLQGNRAGKGLNRI